MCEYVLEFYL